MNGVILHRSWRRAAATALIAALACLGPLALRAQDDEVAAEAPAKPVKKAKPTTKKPTAKTSSKTSSKTSGKTTASPKSAKAPKTTGKKTSDSALLAKVAPIPEGALEALDQALGAYLTEKRITAVVAQEAAAEGPDLTVAIETLDQSLEAQLKKGSRQPATTASTRVTSGLGAVLSSLDQRGAIAPLARRTSPPATPDAPPATPDAAPATPDAAPASPDAASASPDAAPATPEPPPQPSTSAESTPEQPPPPPTQVASLPRTSPPPEPLESTAPPATPDAAESPSTPAAPAEQLTSAVRNYRLTRIVVSRDGGPDQDQPVPSGGTVLPVPLAHKGGNPPVELKLLVRAPAELSLGQATQITAQASALAAGVAGELSLLDEVVDTLRAADGAETTGAAGSVTFSPIKRVGGIFAYQQTFAQGDGRAVSSTTSRSILLNWTDRDATIEMPFAWTTTSPSPVTIRGRLVYAPATRP